MPNFFEGSSDGFKLTDGGDGPEPHQDEIPDSPESDDTTETAPARPAQRPTAGPTRPARPGGIPARPGGIPPRPGGSTRAPWTESAQPEAPAAPEASAAPVRGSTARPPAPARTRSTPAPAAPVAAFVDPIPTPTRIADKELEREYQEHLSTGEAYQPFEDLSTSKTSKTEEDFTKGLAPEEISPQETPEELIEKEEAQERAQKSRFAVRRAKGTGDQSVRAKKKASKKKGSTKKTRAKKGAAVDEVEPQENFSRYTGERKRVKYSMIAAVTIIALLSAGGVKQFFFPEQIPSPDVVTSTVSEQLGFTQFPEELGMGWVALFTEEYLTIDPEAKISRDDRLAPFITDGTAASFNAGGGADTKVSVTGGPFVSGVESIDDERAIYTVSAVVTGGKWVYLKVPVFYDSDRNAFTVYQSPSFVPRPQVADAPILDPEWLADATLSTEMQKHLTPFFESWGASDGQNLERFLLTDASVSARTGLQGAVKFQSLGSVSVEAYTSADGSTDDEAAENPMRERKAIAQVTWADPKQDGVTYTQNYDLVIYQQPDDRWYVKDIDVSDNTTVG